MYHHGHPHHMCHHCIHYCSICGVRYCCKCGEESYANWWNQPWYVEPYIYYPPVTITATGANGDYPAVTTSTFTARAHDHTGGSHAT